MHDSMARTDLAPRLGTPRKRYGLPVAIALILVLGLLAYLGWQALQPALAPAGADLLSAGDLAERYGLGVRLIAVTAGGGLVDVRLKIVDPDKARSFLEDPAHLPRLVAANSGEALLNAEQLGDEVRWEEGGILFILFSNTGGAIRPGTPVIVEFGDVQLEPIRAQ